MLKMTILNKPNSFPFKGKTPKNEAVTPKPKIEESKTEPQEAHPTPRSPITIPTRLIPEALYKLTLWMK